MSGEEREKLTELVQPPPGKGTQIVTLDILPTGELGLAMGQDGNLLEAFSSLVTSSYPLSTNDFGFACIVMLEAGSPGSENWGWFSVYMEVGVGFKWVST